MAGSSAHASCRGHLSLPLPALGLPPVPHAGVRQGEKETRGSRRGNKSISNRYAFGAMHFGQLEHPQMKMARLYSGVLQPLCKMHSPTCVFFPEISFSRQSFPRRKFFPRQTTPHSRAKHRRRRSCRRRRVEPGRDEVIPFRSR